MKRARAAAAQAGYTLAFLAVAPAVVAFAVAVTVIEAWKDRR